ncbi:tRNA (adenosine(37)-N6)-threonylcarbamoyltransferase complex ATPase subunit type 1 TsaE [Pelagibacterium xiamenense]|uniref:tRNA (adenosine(37)-N6)-threonylcarbamoyltransferase complex ATPase subunit type 1 TsaE n=1 Tax=Pelagibacterium xiamenense TaxID=2901140 RepID=UPI001E4A63DA|nr:tRNA (adenosine(37)-N6)-threonylcarbamoyltransferase complex ATPase subunit type 1 TsaE [Pelagibacterium xiamenense]MCD7058585.1 tRNA (adenosine(37)-N6)-threonylcarbamoyltransferase complex ATPase subunit type 1 TsaE [Pelagibacterium xiamenense]
MLTLFAHDAAATDAIGAALARLLKPGDVVSLYGDLGTGKTALARAVIRARLEDADLDVPSPTFALVQPYPGVVHADLYRLSHEDEIDELGLLDDPEAVVLVEWPDRAPHLETLPGYAVTLALHGPGEERILTITERGGRSLDPLALALAPWAVNPQD